jgi:hypothetical protein
VFPLTKFYIVLDREVPRMSNAYPPDLQYLATIDYIGVNQEVDVLKGWFLVQLQGFF